MGDREDRGRIRLRGRDARAARSMPRKLRIISEEQLIEQVWQELSGVRRSAMATDEEQNRLTRDRHRGGEASRMERRPGGRDRSSDARPRGTRTDRAARAGERPARRDARPGDARCQRLLDEAGKSSVKAGEKLRQAGEAEQKAGGADQQKRAEAGREQDRVREDLAA